jgi:hypothetical protein
MFGPEFILANILLVSPVGSPLPQITEEEWPSLQKALQETGVNWEILDPREVKYVFSRLEDFSSDMDLMRKRYRELQDVPRVEDSNRFPDRSAINEMLSFNRGYRRNLESRQIIEPDRADMYGNAMRETDRLYYIWDAVRDSRCEFYYITIRRQALKKLRCFVGTADYYSGQLPPPIPTWRFQEMD